MIGHLLTTCHCHSSSLFRELPESKPLFGLNIDMPEDEIARSKRVLVHASFIIEMVEKALTMLGKNDEELGVFLQELGKKHVAYKVKPEHLPYMSDAIIFMLNDILGNRDSFTPEDEEAWRKVLAALVANMTQAQREVEMSKIAADFASTNMDLS